MAGRPFVLVAVNSDEDQEEARQLAAAEGLDWPCWWDGASGPIVARWGVSCWPTFFVLDAQGVVRYRMMKASELDRAVETLLAEAEGRG